MSEAASIHAALLAQAGQHSSGFGIHKSGVVKHFRGWGYPGVRGAEALRKCALMCHVKSGVNGF